MVKRVALTTIDNPFDPLTDFENWYAFDVQNDYHSSALLARLTFSSSELSEADEDAAIEAAIDEIVKYNVSGVHRKIVKVD